MAEDSTHWPTPDDPCWDCGSDIPQHHTPSCAFADEDDICDLPEVEGTQWWTNAKAFRKE